MRKQRGFTLPELLVVLAIIGLLLSMSVPTLDNSWKKVSMDTAVLKLHRDLRWAQQQAESQQKTVTITFFKDKQPYRYIIRMTGVGELRRRELPKLDTLTAQTIQLNVDRTIQKNGHVLLQRGKERRYVYYYQTGRTRITNAPTSSS